jgi:hypothetical protein
MSRAAYKLNEQLSIYATKLLKMYLKFPEGKPFTALDWKAEDGHFIECLTAGAPDNRFLYAVTKEPYYAENLREDSRFHKVSEAHYTSEAKITNDSFSLMVVDPEIDRRLISELFETVDPFTMPNFEEEIRAKVQRDEAERQRLLANTSDQFDFGALNEDNTEPVAGEAKKETEEQRQQRMQKKIRQEMENRIKAWRMALKEQQINMRSMRKDNILLAQATKYLRPGGVLVMITPKELIDDNITFKLVNNYEDIKIIRLEDDEYEEHRKCIILAKKRPKAAKNVHELGKALARTKEKPYRTFGQLTEITADATTDPELYAQQVRQRKVDEMYEVISPQVTPSYQVPISSPEDINLFRVGPITAAEALATIKKSKTIENYQQKYSQVMTNKNPITPTPLHKGHIMLLLTSGFLNGYIGTGPDQHLVKGSAIKDIREFSEEEDDGTTKIVEREFYNIGVKLLNAQGEFRKIM